MGNIVEMEEFSLPSRSFSMLQRKAKEAEKREREKSSFTSLVAVI